VAKLSLEGVTLHYQLLSPHPEPQRASAPCVVYLHGLVMDNLSSGYFTFAQALSAERSLLLYDLRGHGKSSLTPQGYKVTEHVDELLRLLEALGLGAAPLHLVGSSFGGAVAMEAARRHPKRVQSLVLIDGHPSSRAFFEQLGADLSAPPEAQQALIAQHFQHWLSRGVPRRRDRLAQRAEALIHETSLLDDLRAGAPELSGPLPPTLALYGAESDALSFAQRALAGRPEVTWRLFSGRSHALLWEETDAVREALLEWFRAR